MHLVNINHMTVLTHTELTTLTEHRMMGISKERGMTVGIVHDQEK
jgi:hypothetical protein